MYPPPESSIESYTVALAGNPNVGKSTVFNALTGMHQHTGNWAGKTVSTAAGICTISGVPIQLIDLPGTGDKVRAMLTRCSGSTGTKKRPDGIKPYERNRVYFAV